MTTDVVRRATAGFIVSLIAGVLILINAVAFFSLADFVASFGSMVPIIPFFVEGVLEILAAIGVILAIIILIGAILIFMPGKETIGGILVIIASLVSLIIGGGFIIGLILGLLGGALGIARR